MRIPVTIGLGLLVCLMALAGCGSPTRDLADPARVDRARVLIIALEQKLENLRTLPPRERRDAYLMLQPELERAVTETERLPLVSKPTSTDDTTARSEARSTLSLMRGSSTVGYNFHSKALFWLASWRFLYADGVGVEELLNRLDMQYPPVLLRQGQSLRVRLYLRQGRMAEARALTATLVDALQIPQLAGLKDLVAWYEWVGKPAPRLSDRNLSGGLADPLAGDAPRILVVFTRADDPETVFYMEALRSALAALSESHRPRLMQVTAEGNLLRAAQMVRPSEDLLWVDPNTAGNAERWQTAWKLVDPLPRNALVGPDRTILAVEMTPEMLATLAR